VEQPQQHVLGKHTGRERVLRAVLAQGSDFLIYIVRHVDGYGHSGVRLHRAAVLDDCKTSILAAAGIERRIAGL